MDRKLRISFFPANASRVRIIALSRRWGLAMLALSTLFSLVGFWLILSGALHEDPVRAANRKRLESENSALRDRVEGLEGDAQEVEKGLKRLEELKVDAMLATGLEKPNGLLGHDAGGVWSFFRNLSPGKSDPAASLSRARSIALFYDSTLVVLRNAQEQSETFPTGLPIPRTAMLTRTFGMGTDPFTGRKALHPGLDFSDKPGVPVMASGAGIVVAITKDPVWGISVRLRHRPGMETVYAHLASAEARMGQSLKRGEVLGLLGESGQTTGPHLHYELRLQGERVDPMQFLLPANAGGQWL